MSADGAADVIATPDQLAEHVWNTYGVRIPNVRVCPHHATPWEVFCWGYFAPGAPDQPRIAVLKGSRGLAGKSTLLALLGTVIATTLRGDVSILGGSGMQATRVHKAMAKFWAAPNAPRDLLDGEPSITKTRLHGGAEIEALTASQKSARGPHPLALLLDEVDEMDLGLLDASMGQTMDQYGHVGRTLISSTHQYDAGTMTEVLKRAAQNGWRVFEICYRENLEPHGWLTASQVARKRGEMTATMWNVEVELQDPNPAGRAIDRAKVERMFVGPLIRGDGGDEFAYRELEPPVAGASYATGADWARERDYVEIATLRDDAYPLRLVAYQRFRKVPTPLIIARFHRQLGRYPGASAHDATGGGTYLKDYVDEGTEDVVMQGRRRRDLFTDYLVAVESEDLVAPRVEPLYLQHRNCLNADLFGAGHPPDGIVACALAWRAGNGGRAPLRLLQAREREQRVLDVAAGLVPAPDAAAAPPAGGLRGAWLRTRPGNGNGGGNGNGDGHGG